MFNFYYKPLLKKWFQLTPESFRSHNYFKNVYQPYYTKLLGPIKKKYKKIQRILQISLKPLLKKIIPQILLTRYFTKKKQIWKKYINILKKKRPKIIIMQHGRKPYFFSNKKFIPFWQTIKEVKRKNNLASFKESRKLKWLQIFYRNFGFRRNKNRIERPLMRTKKFKKFTEYNQVLKLLRHKKIFKKYTPYQIQSCRLKGPSYYKMHQQLFVYLKKNYLAKNFTRKKIVNITKKVNRLKKERLVHFVSNIELTVSSLLLRMRLLNTTGIAHQFTKHGNVYINYNKVLSPSYLIKPGDTISIYINSQKQKYHRFHDPLFSSTLMPGLYRKYTGRQSLTTNEKSPEVIKMSLNTFDIWKPSQFTYNIPIYFPCDLYKLKPRLIDTYFIPKHWQQEKKNQKKRFHKTNHKITAWKLGFLAKKIPKIYTQQNKNLVYIYKNIA